MKYFNTNINAGRVIYIFLDFDGVLHPSLNQGLNNFCRLEEFEKCIINFPETKIDKYKSYFKVPTLFAIILASSPISVSVSAGPLPPDKNGTINKWTLFCNCTVE